MRQGCIASPHLFNLYSEFILRSLDDVPEGVLVNGVRINNIRYADDTILIATSEKGLQRLLDEANISGEPKGLSINCKKTKCMVISKMSPPPSCNIQIEGILIQQVESFNYLGSVITTDGRCRKEIRRRIGLAKEAFKKMKPILCDRKLSMTIKNRVLRAFVWSSLLYGSESWTLTAETRQNIQAAEMWFYRRMMKISYVEKVTNIEVLHRVQQKREVIQRIERGQNKFLGHVIRKEAIENLCLNGKIPGKRARGGQRLQFLKQFKANARKLNDAARQRKDLGLFRH